jgi:NAD(P)-dependent dehydrogenase (short-subunit alcohol dehydrogenase family)
MAGERACLVTGGGGGIGAAVCRRLGREGWLVLAAGRDLGRCEAAAAAVREEGGAAHALALDVTEPESIGAALDRARELVGHDVPLEGLVNNAGIAVSAPLLAVLDEQGRDTHELHMNVNFHGARRLVQALLVDMKVRARGRIVNVASSAGLRGYAYVSAYCASKHALVGYTRAAALELAGSGVTMNAVCPHYVDSPMTEASMRRVMQNTHKSEAETRSFFAAQNPGGRLVTVEQVAEAVAQLLAGEESGVILELTGSAVVRTDGAGATKGDS